MDRHGTHAGGPDRLIVCGLHGLGLRLVGALHAAGTPVVAVDPAPTPTARQLLEELEVALVVGSPRLPSVLERAGAAEAHGLLCVEDDDLRSLETALAARQAWPHLRIVSSVSNASVARALAGVTGPGTALDVATLAAPSIVQACLPDRRTRFRTEQVEFEVTTVEVERPASLRQLFGDLVPVAVTRAADGSTELCPGRDVEVAPGDAVRVLATPLELRSQGVGQVGRIDDDRRSRRAPWSGAVLFLRSLWTEVQWPMRLTVLSLVLLTVASATALRLGYEQPGHHHLSVLDSAYFTVETIATVGYGDFSFSHQATWLELVGVAVILLGVTLLTTLFALLTSQLFGRSLAAALGQRRITSMQGHSVVIGLGSVGVRVVEGLLRERVAVVVVERDDANRYLARARELRVPVILGDASQPSTLDAAGAARASAVAVLTSDDLTNLDVGLAVRDHLGAAASTTPVVIRVFDRSLSQSIAANFHFRQVLSTTSLAAPWFIGAALGLEIVSTFYVERQPFLVAAMTVAEGGGLVGLSMQELAARVRVVAIRPAGSADLEHPPRRTTRLSAGDRSWLVGPPEDLLRVLRRNDAPPVAPTDAGAASATERPAAAGR